MPIIIAYIIKKELGVFLRVPGNDQQKTDLVNTLAVVDAHPTTISADGNEEYLVEALAVINSKVENYFMLPNTKTHFSWNYYQNMTRLKKYL